MQIIKIPSDENYLSSKCTHALLDNRSLKVSYKSIENVRGIQDAQIMNSIYMYAEML